MSTIPCKSCLRFPSCLPLFQAVSKVPVPLCHVPHTTAHAVPGDHASSSPEEGHISSSSLVGRDRAQDITSCTSHRTGTGLTYGDNKHIKNAGGMEGGSFHLWFMPAAHGGWPPLHSKDNILNLLFHSLPLHSVMPLTPICISFIVIWSVSILTSSGSEAGLRQVDSIRQPASTNAYINHAFDLQTTNCNKPVSQPDTSFGPCLQLHLPPFNNA